MNVPHRAARTGTRADRIAPIDHVIADRIALQQHAARLCGALPAATPTALLIVELADTGAVSGLLGRPVSDGDVLDEVACQMADVVPHSGALYRLSFNQFAVLIAGESADEFALVAEATETAYRLHRAFQTPTRNGAVLTVMSSIGLAYFPYQAKTWDELLDFADAAMSYSRSHRGTKVTTYGKHARHLAHRRETVARLNDALRNDEFSLRYQPIVALQDGAARISGVEALIRWNDGGKLVLPNEFIPLLEWSGSIGDVGAWVLDTATREMRDVGADGVPLTLSVNVSLPELADHRYLVTLLGILERNRFDPRRLVLEVTESVAMSDLETVAAVLNGAGQVGIRIAIDDFGTGSSTLSRLKDLPIHFVKLDQSFIQDLEACPRTRTLVGGILDIARNLDHITIAEGVETEGQEFFLRARGCTFAQGFRFSQPLTAEELRACIDAHAGPNPVRCPDPIQRSSGTPLG